MKGYFLCLLLSLFCTKIIICSHLCFFRKYGLSDDTVDFIGHALALHRDDRHLNEPALDTVKRMKVSLDKRSARWSLFVIITVVVNYSLSNSCNYSSFWLCNCFVWLCFIHGFQSHLPSFAFSYIRSLLHVFKGARRIFIHYMGLVSCLRSVGFQFAIPFSYYRYMLLRCSYTTMFSYATGFCTSKCCLWWYLHVK